MEYILLGVIIGIVIDKYIFPIFDMLLELLTYQITKLCTSIQIDINLMSLEYQEMAEQGQPLTPVVGFHAGMEQYDEDDEDDDEDNKNKKIGFK